MCEAKVYLEAENKRELVMEDVVTIKPGRGNLEMVDLFGEHRSVAATIKEIRLLDHEVVLSQED